MDNGEMVDRLKQRGYIESVKVEQAFRRVDRRIFVPESREGRAYVDRPLRIGKGQTISAPSMVAINTELLELEEDHEVLEIGSGTGYQAAIIAVIADEVKGVEIEREFVEDSRKNIEEAGLENVEITAGVGLDPVDRRYDRILYSCAIEKEEFNKARDYLSEDGRLVAPVSVNGSEVMKSFQNGKTEDHVRVRFTEYRDESFDLS